MVLWNELENFWKAKDKERTFIIGTRNIHNSANLIYKAAQLFMFQHCQI